MNQNNNGAPDQRKQRYNSYLVIAILIFGPVLFFSFYDSKRIKESLSEPEQQYAATDRVEPPMPAPASKSLTNDDIEAPVARENASGLFASNRIDLASGKLGFTPVEFKGPAGSSALNIQLSQNQATAIRKVPASRGREQWYGYMDLGNRVNKRFHFALDMQSDSTWVLYFDKNNNGDLTDDGKPLRNQGSGAGGPGEFACTISIPWAVLIEDSRFAGNFNIWFFSNQAGWEQGHRVSHYSITQLQGKLRIGNEDYMALLIDQGYNDADLTNDGVAIDLNRDGKIDLNEPPRTVHTINGETYAFNVSW